jgi:uncharacterized RDD family membrane protein YckC
MDVRRNTVVARTPEGVSFSLELAGPVSRCMAFLLDICCVMAMQAVAGKAASLMGILSMDMASGFAVVSYFVLSMGYGMLTEWAWRGQTLGKRLLRLRVMDADGLALTFPQIALRNLLRPVDALPAMYLAGGLCMLATRRAQRLGDIAARTIVVRARETKEPDLDGLLPDKYNSLRRIPHLAARLRQRVGVEAAGIALSALTRRDGMNPEDRVRLFAEIAAYFKETVTFPPEATEGLSDERYVKNVVDVLYRT